MSGMLVGREAFASAFNVSRETLARLDAYEALLLRWNQKINLIGPATVADIWGRHFADSAQLVALAPPNARHWLDLGAGAGFPGLVIAAMTASQGAAARVTLVESDARKAAFLRAASLAMGVSATVLNIRIEALEPARLDPPPDVIVSRALAPLVRLLGYAQAFAGPGAVCLFHKGAGLESELTEARRHWHIRCVRHPSLTDPDSGILEIQEFRARDD